jgi:hypothetical protein
VLPLYLPIYVRAPPTTAAVGLAKVLPVIFIPLWNFVNTPSVDLLRSMFNLKLIFKSHRRVNSHFASVDLPFAFFLAFCATLQTHFIFRPYVASIHLKLPPEARRSQANLFDYLKSLPRKQPVLIFTTMNMAGLPKRTEESLDDLSVVKTEMYDYLRLAPELHDPFGRGRKIISSQKKDWFLRRRYEATPSKEGEKKSQFPGVWSKVFKKIRQHE